MKAYFDTGLLLKLYAEEADSPAAADLIFRHGTPICFTDLQRAEVQNALHRKCARREITADELALTLRRIGDEVAAGDLQAPEVEWSQVWAEVNHLTERHAMATQCRTLDALHIAVALRLGMESFGTTDVRQAALAQRAGLDILTP